MRFENDNEIDINPFSMGLTLKKLIIKSTDENWNPKFINRKNLDIPLRKLLQL